MLSEKAQEASIDVFSMNVERLLTQRPIKDKWVLGFDPAFRTGCKLAVIDATGKMVEISVIYPHPPKARKEEAKQELLRLLSAYPIEIIAIGNGTASRESEALSHRSSANQKWMYLLRLYRKPAQVCIRPVPWRVRNFLICRRNSVPQFPLPAW